MKMEAADTHFVSLPFRFSNSFQSLRFRQIFLGQFIILKYFPSRRPQTICFGIGRADRDRFVQVVDGF